MPRNWSSIANADGIYEPADFQRAMYMLLTHQCLFSRFNLQGPSYRIIAKYQDDFKEAFALMGLKMDIDPHKEFCYLVPDHSIVKDTQMSRQNTLFLLVLRHIYHTKACVGDANEDGDIFITIDELVTDYKLVTGQELETKRETLSELLNFAKRKGLADSCKKEDADPQPFAVVIYPSIVVVLSEYAVGRFGAQLKSSMVLASKDVATAEQEGESHEKA
jgi:hypothetical protein